MDYSNNSNVGIIIDIMKYPEYSYSSLDRKLKLFTFQVIPIIQIFQLFEIFQ